MGFFSNIFNSTTEFIGNGIYHGMRGLGYSNDELAKTNAAYLLYDDATTIIGEEIVHPAMIGLGYTNAEIADPDTGPAYFHDLADAGDRAMAFYQDGEVVSGMVAANAGAAGATGGLAVRTGERALDAAGETLKETWNDSVKNGIWNNVIVSAVGGLAGNFIGKIAGSILGSTATVKLGGIGGGLGSGIGQLLGIAGGAAAGWFLGDEIMKGIGISVEPDDEKTVRT